MRARVPRCGPGSHGPDGRCPGSQIRTVASWLVEASSSRPSTRTAHTPFTPAGVPSRVRSVAPVPGVPDPRHWPSCQKNEATGPETWPPAARPAEMADSASRSAASRVAVAVDTLSTWVMSRGYERTAVVCHHWARCCSCARL